MALVYRSSGDAIEGLATARACRHHGRMIDESTVQLFNLFPTPLVVSAVPNSASLNEDLTRIIRARATAVPSVNKSNRHGWQSGDDFFNWAGDAGARLRAHATELVNTVTRAFTPGTFTLQPFAGEWKINGWANVNRQGARNEVHSHAGCFWSGCYYVAADGTSAPLELHDPRGTAPIMYAPTLRMNIKGCVTAGSIETYAPQAGSMVLFPSWLLHSVAEQTGDGERISVAFNFSI